MLKKLTIPMIAAIFMLVATGCKITVPTPIGPVIVEYNGNAAEAYKRLEKALAECLDHYTAAVLSGDQGTASGWQDVINQITGAKEELASGSPVGGSKS